MARHTTVQTKDSMSPFKIEILVGQRIHQCERRYFGHQFLKKAVILQNGNILQGDFNEKQFLESKTLTWRGNSVEDRHAFYKVVQHECNGCGLGLPIFELITAETVKDPLLFGLAPTDDLPPRFESNFNSWSSAFRIKLLQIVPKGDFKNAIAQQDCGYQVLLSLVLASHPNFVHQYLSADSLDFP